MANAEKTVRKTKPHEYTSEERLALGSKIAETLKEQKQIARDKKQSMAEFKSLEEECTNKLENLCENHDKGYEIREYECYELRDRDTKTVNYVTMDGTIIDSRPFNNADWAVILDKTQLGMFPDYGEGPDEDEIRAYANAQAAAQTPIDFEPAAITISLPGWDAEAQATFNNLCITTTGMSLQELQNTLLDVNRPVDFNSDIEESIFKEFAKFLETKIANAELAVAFPDDLPAEPTPEIDDNTLVLGPDSDDAATATETGGDADGEQEATQNGGPSAADLRADAADMLGDNNTDEDEAASDEPSDDEQPKPRTPKRPAKRIS